MGGALAKHPDENRISIGNDVWIGSGSTILRKENLIIGNGVVIGGGTVVTKSIPDYAIVVGVPGRVIKYRFPEDIIKRLLKIKWWEWDEKRILQKEGLLTQKLTHEVLDELESEI